MKKGSYVAYFRVSTKRQGESRLGLEAQQTAVKDFLNGGKWNLLGSFEEIESGGKNDRPELQKALHLCKLTGATLLVAKIDRLSRDAAFLLNLQKSSVKFVACDMPEANDMTVGILALVAQYEREQISTRIKAALKEAKKRGTKLGNPNGAAALQRYIRENGNVAAVERIKGKARRRAHDLKEILWDFKDRGYSLRQIADKLTERGILTARGGKVWHPSSVAVYLHRLDS